MTLKNILMAGAALGTVGAAPAFASTAPHIHVMALHAGAVVKSKMHSNAGKTTYTFSVSTGVSTKAAYNTKTNLAGTFYTWLSSSTLCKQPKKEKVTLSVPSTMYATLGTGTETYSEGCGAPTYFYGDTYTLTTKKAKNKTDTFSSALKAKYKNASGKFNGTLNINVSVLISK